MMETNERRNSVYQTAALSGKSTYITDQSMIDVLHSRPPVNKDYSHLLENMRKSKKMFWVSEITTQYGKRRQACLLMSMVVFPFVAVLIFASQLLASAIIEESKLVMIKNQIEACHKVGDLLHALQLERARAMFVVKTQREMAIASMDSVNSYTDKTLNKIDDWESCGNVTYFKNIGELRDTLHKQRINLLLHRRDSLQYVVFYNQLNAVILDYIVYKIYGRDFGTLWNFLISYKMILRAKENLGITIALGIEFYLDGYLPVDDMTLFLENDALGADHVRMCVEYAREIEDKVNEYLKLNDKVAVQIQHFRKEIRNTATTNGSVEAADQYYQAMTLYLNVLKDVKYLVTKQITHVVTKQINVATDNVVIALIVLGIALITLALLVYFVYNIITTIQNYAQDLSEKSDELKAEKTRSDDILFQMLPKSVARQLKIGESVPAEHFDSVTIYFSDIVDFTTISAKSQPIEIVNLLNKLYCFFDEACCLYDVYKVETIGDAYMAVSGLPTRNGDMHASEVASLALFLLESMNKFNLSRMEVEKLRLRIGIHTGPCVAGIVGKTMPRYSLFGDTVNTASRMETTGLSMKIHVSMTTKQALDHFGGYYLVPRGVIDVKGKGNMETFFLNGSIHPMRQSKCGTVIMK